MKLSVILSVFERHYVVSLGGEVQHEAQHGPIEEPDDPDRVELQTASTRATVGFRPNDKEDDDE